MNISTVISKTNFVQRETLNQDHGSFGPKQNCQEVCTTGANYTKQESHLAFGTAEKYSKLLQMTFTL